MPQDFKSFITSKRIRINDSGSHGNVYWGKFCEFTCDRKYSTTAVTPKEKVPIIKSTNVPKRIRFDLEKIDKCVQTVESDMFELLNKSIQTEDYKEQVKESLNDSIDHKDITVNQSLKVENDSGESRLTMDLNESSKDLNEIDFNDEDINIKTNDLIEIEKCESNDIVIDESEIKETSNNKVNIDKIDSSSKENSFICQSIILHQREENTIEDNEKNDNIHTEIDNNMTVEIVYPFNKAEVNESNDSVEENDEIILISDMNETIINQDDDKLNVIKTSPLKKAEVNESNDSAEEIDEKKLISDMNETIINQEDDKLNVSIDEDEYLDYYNLAMVNKYKLRPTIANALNNNNDMDNTAIFEKIEQAINDGHLLNSPTSINQLDTTKFDENNLSQLVDFDCNVTFDENRNKYTSRYSTRNSSLHLLDDENLLDTDKTCFLLDTNDLTKKNDTNKNRTRLINIDDSINFNDAGGNVHQEIIKESLNNGSIQSDKKNDAFLLSPFYSSANKRIRK